MNSQEMSVKRLLPLPLVAYHIVLKILHSGMTADAVLKMDDVNFGKFIAQAMQITCDAFLVPYQRDFIPGFGFSMTGGLGVVARGTENMVFPSPASLVCVYIGSETNSCPYSRVCRVERPSF